MQGSAGLLHRLPIALNNIAVDYSFVDNSATQQ